MKRRNKFNLSFYNLLSCKMGWLVPVGLTELLPGDSIQLSHSLFMRLAPMVAPVMHPVHLTIQSFFVPLRILWDEFEEFITGGPDGLNASVPPTVTLTPEVSGLADYLGLPTGNEISVSALPFRAYNLIWNEYYRDQDLQTELAISTDSGPDTTTLTALQRVDWQKDYFTTARPWPQKGVGVTVPIESGSGYIPVVATGQTATLFPMTSQQAVNITVSSDASNLNFFNNLKLQSNVGSEQLLSYGPEGVAYQGLAASLGGATGVGVDISALREAFALQRFEEKRALFGSRYEDYLRLLGVRPRDSRLQMPEYLGGASRTVQFSEVLGTSEDNPGQLYGHGVAAMGSGRIRYFAPENGYLMSLMFVRPIPIYTQGIERTWTRQTKEDYWQKGFEHIGQQQVYNREIYAQGTDADAEVFGWQNRYDEYRRGKNHVSGEFRTTQDYWHMARVFTSLPALNSDFVTSMPTDRIFQANEQQSDQLYCMIQNRLIARRFLSKNGNPI